MTERYVCSKVKRGTYGVWDRERQHWAEESALYNNRVFYTRKSDCEFVAQEANLYAPKSAEELRAIWMPMVENVSGQPDYYVYEGLKSFAAIIEKPDGGYRNTPVETLRQVYDECCEVWRNR